VAFSSLTKCETYIAYMLEMIKIYVIDVTSNARIVALLYKLLKVLIVAWMIHPKYQGALLLYYKYIERPFKDREENIRDKISAGLAASKRCLE
jgi:hypothetical protein